MKFQPLLLRIVSAVALVGIFGFILHRYCSDDKSSEQKASIAGHTRNLALASSGQIQALQKEQEARIERELIGRDFTQDASRPMDILMGKLGESSYRERLAALRLILAAGHDKDIMSLYQVAGQPVQGPAFKGLKHLEWAGLVNEIMDYAVNTDPDTTRAMDYLYGMATAKKLDPTIRDYAFQHLGAMVARLGQAESPDKEAQDKVKKVLWKMAQNPRSPLAGTSMISLNRMTNEGTMDAEPDRFREAAVTLLKHPSADLASQVTCLALSARLGYPEALTAARNILKEESNVVQMVVCIGVMGQMGEKADMTVLDQLSKNDEPMVKRAANTALNRLKTRLGTS